MLIFGPKKGDFAFKVVLLEGVVSELVAPLIFENRDPVRDVLKTPGFAYATITQEFRSRSRQPFFFFFFNDVFKNRAPVRSILEISSTYLHQTRSK